MRERPQLVLGQDIRKRSRASPDERRRGEFSGEGHQKPENSYSLAYNLENQVQHVKLQYEHCGYRIGECKKFKGKTIKELMERVIEYSKTPILTTTSGNYQSDQGEATVSDIKTQEDGEKNAMERHKLVNPRARKLREDR